MPRGGHNKGKKLNQEQKDRVSLATKLAMARPEVKAKVDRANLLKIGKPSFFKGRKHTDEAKLKNRLAHIGKPNLGLKGRRKWYPIWNKGKKLGPMSEENRIKISQAHKKRVKEGKCHLWKGGITKSNRIIRTTLEYRLWRESVFKRDNYTCVFCGDNRGGNLEADHIKPFAFYPELRFAIDNGRTLCHTCHLNTDTYGNRVLKDNNKNI